MTCSALAGLYSTLHLKLRFCIFCCSVPASGDQHAASPQHCKVLSPTAASLGQCLAAPDLHQIVTQQQYLQLQQPQEQHCVQLAGQQHRQPQVLAVVADVRVHWLVKFLGIILVNVLGLWGVIKLISWARDSSTPVSVLRLHVGLRLGGHQLQERLHFLRNMMQVEHGIFFTVEEAVQAICQPPRGTHAAYASVSVQTLRSKHEGYELFNQAAAVEERDAATEEAAGVLHDTELPDGCDIPQPKGPLQRLLSIGSMDQPQSEACQSCVVVRLVMLAAGTIQLPQNTTQDLATFRSTMKQLCGGLRTGQLLAVELLMTPDDPDDFLSEAQLRADYPFLTDLSTGLLIRAHEEEITTAGTPISDATPGIAVLDDSQKRAVEWGANGYGSHSTGAADAHNVSGNSSSSSIGAAGG
eukprot:GHRR01026550.1.p1 GENE.GHRR01026550.1~~GHRR01026550.1.p1  ORF type:complete len:412 (+),score=157.41 GHRR01026550.1:202-1437(+)